MTKAALAHQRKMLKIRLFRERGLPVEFAHTEGMRAPVCAYCGKPIWSDCCVMHEWLIKRNRLPVKLQHKIMHEYNCVLAHNDCHAEHGQTTVFKMRCARAQYKRYGRDKIMAWVKSLRLRQAVEIPEDLPCP